MPLLPLEIEINADTVALTESECTQIKAAEQAVASLRHREPNVTRLLQTSDAVAFCAGMRALLRHRCLTGRRFCEWGSGVGLIAALASLHGFTSCGIEAESLLFREAQKTFSPTGNGPRFAHGSFVPSTVSGQFQVVGTYGATLWQPSIEPDPYAALGLSSDEFDLIYAYPWPREINLYESLFECCAGPDAVLWLYIQGAAPRFWRKVRQD